MPPNDQAIQVRRVVRRPQVVTPGPQLMQPAGRFHRYWEQRGGVPGNPVAELETGDGWRRQRYANGTIYESRAGVAWVYGAIGEKYDQLGGPASWLGLPTGDEQGFVEGGRVTTFANGSIYWWPDVGAVELNDIRISYRGVHAFGETDWDQGSDGDEPYVVLGVITPTDTITHRSGIYGGVDGGETRHDDIELSRGKPYGGSLSVLMMEHDEGNPDKYRDAMSTAVAAAATGLTAAIAVIPVAGPVLATVAAPLLGAATPAVASALNDLLDTGDDVLGQVTLNVSAKQMIVLAARTPENDFRGIKFKLETPLFSGGGGSYKAYFNFVPV